MYNQLSMSPLIGKLVLHHRSQGACFGTLDGFFLMRCFGVVFPEDLYATLKAHEAVLARRPQGSGSIVAIDSTVAFPSEEIRRVAAEVSRKTSLQTSAQATIVLGDGFWASAVRGIMTTLTSVVPAQYPRRVFRREEEAVDWTITVLGESVPKYRPLLLAGLTQLKAGLVVSSPEASNSEVP
jgi:hypothetical protein